MKTTLAIIYFNLGVDVLGFTKIWVHKLYSIETELKSRFFKSKNVTKTYFAQYEL